MARSYNTIEPIQHRFISASTRRTQELVPGARYREVGLQIVYDAGRNVTTFQHIVTEIPETGESDVSSVIVDEDVI